MYVCVCYVCVYMPCHIGMFIVYTGLGCCSLNWQWFGSPQSTLIDVSNNRENNLNFIFDYWVPHMNQKVLSTHCPLLLLGNWGYRRNWSLVFSSIISIWSHWSCPNTKHIWVILKYILGNFILTLYLSYIFKYIFFNLILIEMTIKQK